MIDISMAALVPAIKDTQFVNWLKGALALLFTKQGLDGFVNDEMIQFQKDLLASIIQTKGLPAGTICTSCTIKDVLPCPTQNICSKGQICHVHGVKNPKTKPYQPCKNKLCQDIRDGIISEHRYGRPGKGYDGPSWKNTKAENWCIDAFEMAKCFMPPDGYSAVTTLGETDFNGTLAVIINNKRFENKMAAPLNQSNNVCLQARDIGRKIRHSADLYVSDTDLVQYIDTLINLLSDPNYLSTNQNAQDAVVKLKQLKANTLTITTKDITNVIDDAIRERIKSQGDIALQAVSTRSDEALEKIEVKKCESLQLLKDVESSLANVQTVAAECLDKIIAEKISAIHNIKIVAAKEKHELKSIGSSERALLQKELQKDRVMKEDLISFYKECYSTIPVAPLVEEHDAPLTDFYVEPPLTSVDVQIKFRSSQQLPTKVPIQSYSDLFLRGDGKMYKHIYVTAKAGVGKTSFAKKVCMTWCQAHSPNTRIKHKFNPDDLDAMRKFEFLFMVSLRDIETSECDLEKMITSSLLNQLKSRSRYSIRDLEDILNEKTCLLLLDGLDEWTHPTSCDRGCRDVHAIPYIPAREQCTVMTTTRPWKFDVVKLGTSQIDRHVEINELNESSSKELISNAVTVLNTQTQSNQTQTVEDFESKTSTLKLDYLRYIPYILLQIICLWFDGKSIGGTKCEIYTNILTLTLTRGLIKLENKISLPKSRRNLPSAYNIPHCLQLSDICKSHYHVLIALAELAFTKIFSSKAESSLVFDKSEVIRIISEDTLKFCLKIGILSQTRDDGLVSERRSTISFQHKSIQEYFAALYIQSRFDDQYIQERIRKECNTLPAILKMSNVFIFLAGLNSIAFGHIVQIFMNNVSAYKDVRYYRNHYMNNQTYLPRRLEYWEIMKSWQCMLTDSAQEIINNNGESNIPLHIEDIIIDSTITLDTCVLLKSLTENKNNNIKSMTITECQSTEEFTEKFQALDLQGMHSLHKLVIDAVPEEQDLDRLLSGSVDTLSCLVLDYSVLIDNLMYSKSTEMLAETVGILLRMDNLQTIALANIRLRHVDIKHLFQYLKTRQTMTYIRLQNINCKDHYLLCEGVCLDLSRHQSIKELILSYVSVSMLHVDSSSLEFCEVGHLRSCVEASLRQCLPEARNLTAVSFVQFEHEKSGSIIKTLSKLKRLESVAIQDINLADTALTLPTQMLNLELVFLNRVTMTSTSLRCLVNSVAVLPQQVTINLSGCTVKPDEDYRQVKKEICSSPKYQVVFDGLTKSRINQYQFFKLKSAT